MNHRETVKEIEKLISFTYLTVKIYDHYSSNPKFGKDKTRDIHIHLFNHNVFQLEIINQYYDFVKNDVLRFDEMGLFSETKDRLIYIQTTAFIKTVSSIEYVFKQWLAESENVGTNIKNYFKKRYQTFGGIVNAMKRDEFLPDDMIEILDHINFLRNCIVHNDSISQNDRVVDIGPVEIKCMKDESIELGIHDLALINIKLVEVFSKFYCRLLGLNMVDEFPELTNGFIEKIYLNEIVLGDLDDFI